MTAALVLFLAAWGCFFVVALIVGYAAHDCHLEKRAMEREARR